tara:strand:+ start:774 stop:1040 length:267 start_codon:yes stop_codon:yes gene_type:complete
MPAIEDHSYLKICAQIASRLSISLASARRKVEIIASQSGVRDLESRTELAEKLLKKVLSEEKGKSNSADQLDKLLEALASEENFMTED